MCERYAVARSVKHVFNGIIRDTSDVFLAEVAAGLLNCLGADLQPKNTDNKKKRKRKKGKKSENHAENLIEIGKTSEFDPDFIWSKIKSHAETHFSLKLPQKLGFWEAVGSSSLLTSFKREVCLQIGLQVDISTNLKTRISFNNICGFSPKVKYID